MRDLAVAGPGHRAPDRHVPVPRAHRPVAAQDRPAFRRPGPHHGYARRPEDPVADGRTSLDLQPGHRAHQPHQAASTPELATAAAIGALRRLGRGAARLRCRPGAAPATTGGKGAGHSTWSECYARPPLITFRTHRLWMTLWMGCG